MGRYLMMSAVDRRRAVTGIVVAATAFMLPRGGAANTGEEAEFARAILTKVYDLFLNQNYSDEEVEQRLIVLFDETFDVPTVSRFALGRYWRSASLEEREEYQRIFSTYFIKNYWRRGVDRSEAAKDTWDIVSVRALDDVDSFVICRVVRPTAPPKELVLRTRLIEGRLRLIDAVMDGISVLSAVRDDFTSAIRVNGGKVESLIALMRARIEASE
ncbi:MAG: ABC transporter substrate-binding protein [Alphaproteobacteria bacterium]|nr:ABC transporter substrate-binding protein [Alphaproteobacteria bacterium]